MNARDVPIELGVFFGRVAVDVALIGEGTTKQDCDTPREFPIHVSCCDRLDSSGHHSSTPGYPFDLLPAPGRAEF